MITVSVSSGWFQAKRRAYLRLRPHELLFELDQLGTLGFLVFQPLNLLGHLGLVVSTRLDGTLGVANLLQDGTIILEVLSKQILLLAHLGQQDADLVGDVGDGVIARGLAPVGDLGGDGDSFARGGLVGADGMVLGFDDLEELLAEFGLLHAAQGGHGEAVLGRALLGGGRIMALLGPDGKRAVPGEGDCKLSRSEEGGCSLAQGDSHPYGVYQYECLSCAGKGRELIEG